MERPIAAELVSFARGLSFADIPMDVIGTAKKSCIDNLGTMIAGSRSDIGKKLAQHTRMFTGEPKAHAVSVGEVLFEKAVFHNSICSRILDLDDGHRFSCGHPSTVIIPTALGIGEMCDASGKDFIAAVVAGYEVYIRLGCAINPSSLKEVGFDATSTCGVMAAAVTASKLMGLSEEKMLNAFGIAGSQAGGLYECIFGGSMPKLICPGWAASTGIVSAMLADKGFTGPDTIIEGEKGFCQAFSRHYSIDSVTKSLGTEYLMRGVYYKRYACMRGLHAAIDAVIRGMNEYMIERDALEQVRVRTTGFVKTYEKYDPQDIVEAQASIPYCVAVALKHGDVSLRHVTSCLRDPEIAAIGRKVAVIVDPAMEEYVSSHPSEWAAVEVDFLSKDGRKQTIRVSIPEGDPENPISESTLRNKFFELSGHLLSGEQSTVLYEQVSHMEQCGSIKPLMNIFNQEPDI